MIIPHMDLPVHQKYYLVNLLVYTLDQVSLLYLERLKVLHERGLKLKEVFLKHYFIARCRNVSVLQLEMTASKQIVLWVGCEIVLAVRLMAQFLQL